MRFETTSLGHRYTDEELADEARAPQPGRSPFSLRAPGNAAGGPPATPEEARQRREERRKFSEKVAQFYKDEGALALLSYGYNGDGGTIFASSGGSYDPKKPIALASVALTPEHYNRIARLMEHKIPVKLQFNIRNETYENNLDSVNVVAEIPGNRKKDEIVMLGAHLDSWHGGTGATDNAAGSAVVMEAVRILKSLNMPMDRTVRMALWGGEEEGLLGSRAYVKEHFADRETMKLKAEHAKLAGYFNSTTAPARSAESTCRATTWRGPSSKPGWRRSRIWVRRPSPFATPAAPTTSPSTRSGIPGFQFIQDPMEYSTRTHHSNMDVYDHIQPGDLMQASAIMASFVYNAAMRDEMLPRKPLPKPQPPQRRPAATE